MTFLIIAEKEKVAQNVAKILGGLKNTAVVDKQGHIEVGDVLVGWVSGHIYTDCRPEEYGYKFGDINNMPVIVREGWKKTLIDQNKCRFLAGRLSELSKRADVIVHLGDSAREGQIIVDEVIEGWGGNPFDPHIKRMWLKNPSANAVKLAWEDLKLNEEFRPFHEAAMARSLADWAWGMTFTGLFTTLARKATPNLATIISLGRVRTPVQTMLARREQEMLSFKPQTHYKPIVLFKKGEGTLISGRWVLPSEELNEDGLLLDKGVVDKLLARLKQIGSGTVESFETKPQKTSQPLTYNLATLSQEAARRHDFTAERTLELAQKLYDGYGDQPFLTYPRTDCAYMSKEGLATVSVRLENLKGVPEWKDIVERADSSIISPSWIEENDPRIEDHDALSVTPEATPERIAKLPPDERKIFDIVAKRFIEQFYPPYEYNSSKAVIKSGSDEFRASGNIETKAGWKAAFGKDSSHQADDDDGNKDENGSALPILKVGETLPIGSFKYGQGQTTCPKPYTDATLLAAMMNPASLVSDPEMRRKIRATDGIGTAATRSATIEALLKYGYAGRPNKSKKTEIRITPFGMGMINAFPEEVKSIGMTAIWEGRLSDVVKGKLSRNDFLEDIYSTLSDISGKIIEKHSETGIKIDNAPLKAPQQIFKGDGEVCPECGKGKLKSITVRAKVKEGQRPPKNPVRYPALACKDETAADGRGCGYLKFVNEKLDKMLEEIAKLPAPKPLVGDGLACPKCHSGQMKTSYFPGKDGIFTALLCNNGECKNRIYSSQYKKMSGEGKICPECERGKMVGITGISRTTKKEYSCLICTSDGFPNQNCKHREFPMPSTNWNVSNIDGDGKVCPKCGNGFMKTGERVSKKTGKPYKALFCMIDENTNGCGNIEFSEKKY